MRRVLLCGVTAAGPAWPCFQAVVRPFPESSIRHNNKLLLPWEWHSEGDRHAVKVFSGGVSHPGDPQQSGWNVHRGIRRSAGSARLCGDHRTQAHSIRGAYRPLGWSARLLASDLDDGALRRFLGISSGVIAATMPVPVAAR